MMISDKAIMVFLIGMLALGAQAASFDCAKASSLVEKVICAESRLSELDQQLAISYKETLANVADVDSLKAGQLAGYPAEVWQEGETAQPVARFKSQAKARNWIAFMRGDRFAA